MGKRAAEASPSKIRICRAIIEGLDIRSRSLTLRDFLLSIRSIEERIEKTDIHSTEKGV
jgi:hypothetical protein